MTVPVWTRAEDLRSALGALRASGERIVLVPTMGDLHDGHLALVRAGLPFGRVVVSIFVNPTQFAPGEDYENYPRHLEEDLEKLRPLGVTGVFAPATEELYPGGESTRVEVRRLSEPLCGAHRDGHFLGVTTVCTKLFVLTGCDLAVFGQKDAQQCLVIRRLVLDLGFDTELLFVPTVREKSGVAMSSRNRYLQGDDIDRSQALFRALGAGKASLDSGERSVAAVEASMQSVLADLGVKPDYAEVRRVPDLEHPEVAEGRLLIAVAAYVGAARLIDNLCVEVGDTVVEVPLCDDHAPAALAERWAGLA